MKWFKFTLLMVGILLFGSIHGQTPPKLSMQVQKGIGFGADPDLYRILDTNVIDISVNPGSYGDKVVSLSYVIKKDGQVINNLADYGSVDLNLPGVPNYSPNYDPWSVFDDTTFRVKNAQGDIPSMNFCYQDYQRLWPDGLSLRLLVSRKLQLRIVWKVPGTYTIEWVLNERDSAFDNRGRLVSQFIRLTPYIYETFNTKKGAALMKDTMTMVLRAPAMSYVFPDTIDTYDSTVRPLDIKAYSYVDQKGFVAYQVDRANLGSTAYRTVSSNSGLYPYGNICISSTDAQGIENTQYSTCLSGIGLFGGSGNHVFGSIGKLDTLNNMVYTEMYQEGNYRIFLWMVHEYNGAYDTLVADTVYFVVKKKIRPIVHFLPEVPVRLSVGAEFFGSVEFKANDFADTTGKISFVVKKDGVEIPTSQLAQYGYLQIGDKVLSDGKTAYPTNSTILLGRCDTTLRIDAKWKVTGSYTIEAYEDHYVNGAFRRHLAGDTLTLNVDGRRLPFLVLYPYRYPDTVINYTKDAYYWFDLMKENGWDYRNEWVDLKYEIAYSNDGTNWDTTTYSFDELGFMLVKPRLNGGTIVENDTIHYYNGMFPFTKVGNNEDAVIRLGSLDTATRVDIQFRKAGFYRIVYSFEQWLYPQMGPNTFIGGQYRYNSMPVAWISHDTTIFHIKDSVLPKGELVPSVVNLGTDIDFHVGVRMDAGSYQYSNYTVPTYINYELSKKDANGVYRTVTNVNDYGYFSMTYRGQTISGKGKGRIPQPHLSTYLLDVLHNDTLHIDFRCNHDQAGDYSMRIQIMQFDTHRYEYPDTIRHGLLHDTTFYFTFDSLKLPTLTVDPNNWDPYCVGADYFHEITLRANGYANMISDIEYEIFRNGVPVTNVNDYATFHIGDLNITQGKGVIPYNPVKMGLLDTAIMSIVTWDSTGLYEVAYKLRGYVDGVQIVEFLRDTFRARVISRPLPFLVLYPYKYPDKIINYTKDAYYWFDLMKENGWEFRREYVDLHYDIAYSTDSATWDTAGLVFDDHGYMIVVPKLNSPAGVSIPEYDTLHTWAGRFPMKDTLQDRLIRLGALDTCTRVDIQFKKAGFYRIIYNFRLYNYPVMGPNSFVGNLSNHPEVRMIALLSHDTTIFHVKDSVLPKGELVPNMLTMGTEVQYHVGMKMDAGSYQYSEYTCPVYINYELSKKDGNGVYQTVTNVADYGYFSMSYDGKSLVGKAKGRIPEPHLSTYLLDVLHNDTLHIRFMCKEGQAGDYSMRIQIIQFDTNRYRYPDTIRHGLLHDSIYYFTFEELERPTVTLDPDPENERCLIKGADYTMDAIIDAKDYKDSTVNVAYSIYFKGPNDNQYSLVTNVSDYGKLSVNNIPVVSGAGMIPTNPFVLQQNMTFPVEMNWKEEGDYRFVYELKGYVSGMPVMSFYTDTFSISVCEYALPSFVILPDPIYSNDSNGFGDNFDYHFVSRANAGDLGNEPMWLITDWSFEDLTTGTITPMSKLSDQNAAATITYKGVTHTVVNGKDTLGSASQPMSFWTTDNIYPVLLFGNIGNYHLNMKLYTIRYGKAFAKVLDTTLVIRARDVDSVTFNADEIQNHVDTVDPYVTHVDSTFKINFLTSDRYADTIDPYVSVDYRVIYTSLDSSIVDSVITGDFSDFGHLKLKWKNQTLTFANGCGSIPGDAAESAMFSSLRLRDLLKDTLDFVPNVHPMGYYTFEFVAREWRDTAGLPPYVLPNGASALTKAQSMQVATVSRIFSFTVEYRAKYPTVDMIATNEDSIVHTSFDIECGQEYKPNTVYTFDFICHPNSFPDSLAGLFFQVYKDGVKMLTAAELAQCVDSLSFTFRNHTVNITVPVGNLAHLFTGVDSLMLGRVYDPVTGDITPITMTVRWKENASGNYMITGLLLEYVNGVRSNIGLSHTTCYFVVKDNPAVTITTASILNDPTVRVINNDTNYYPAYDTLVFDINIDPKAYANDYTSLDLTVYYQKDSNSTPVVVDTLSKIGLSADFVMDMLGRSTVAPKTYVMDAVNAIPTAFSQEVVGVKDSLNSLMLKYLGGNTIQFRPFVTDPGLYTFDFTLRAWNEVTKKVAVENVLAGANDGQVCTDLWNGQINIAIEEPTINVDPVFPQVTNFADSVDYPFFIKTTKGSYLYTDGYVHYKVYHMADSNGNVVDTAITDLGKYGKMNFIHPILGTMYYAPNSGEGTVPTLDTLYKLKTILTNIMWYVPGTYRIVYDLDIVRNSVDIPKAYDTLDMVVRSKIKPQLVLSGFDSSFLYPTNIEQDFDLRLISNDYLFDYGAMFYCMYHNDTAIDDQMLNSVYGDLSIDISNVNLCNIPFDGNIPMRAYGWIPGKRNGLDYIRLGIFDPAVMNINANFKEPGEYKIVFNLYLWDTANSTVACEDPIGLVNAGSKGMPTIIITRDSLIIHVVDRPNVPVVTVTPQPCDPDVAVPTSVEQVYDVNVTAGDYYDVNATIRYEILRNGVPMTNLAPYGTMQVSKNGIVGQVTAASGFLNVGGVTNVPLSVLESSVLKTMLTFDSVGRYTMIYSIYGWGNTINAPAAYLSTDTININVVDRVMPTTQTTLTTVARPLHALDTFKVYMHAAEYEYVMGRVAVKLYYSPDSGRTMTPINNVSDFGATSVLLNGSGMGYNMMGYTPLTTHMDTIPSSRFVRLGAAAGMPVEVISQWDSVGTYIYTYEILQWDCYDSTKLDQTTYQHRPIYGEISQAGGHAVNVLYRDTLMMHVYPQYLFVEDSIELCANELPYQYNDQYMISNSIIKDASGATIQGTVRDTLVLPMKSVHGLDSIVYLYVQVNPVYEITLYDTVNNLGAYTRHGFNETFYMQGNYVLRQVKQTVKGCDSVVIDSVLVAPSFVFNDTITICSDAMPYPWRNQNLATAGMHYDSLKTIYGADSVYTLLLNVDPTYYYYDTINVPMWNTASVYSNIPTVTLPYTYAKHMGATYVCDSIGDFEFHFKTVNGCDSIAYVNVNAYPMMRTIADLNGNRSNKQIYCYGDTVNLNIAVDNTYGTGGIVYAFANTNPNIGLATVGTGSTTQFVALNKTNIPQEATLIMGAVVKHMGSRSVDVYEGYTHTFVSTEVLADSCMDVARPDTIHMMVMPKYEFFDTVTICSTPNMPYTMWQNQILTSPGNYTASYASVIGGCDSVYHLVLNVNPSYHYYDTINVPMWNTASVYSNIPTVKLPYTYAVHKGASYVCDSIGDFVFNFKTVDGCDSIAYVNVNAYPMMRTIADLNGNRSNKQIYCYGDTVNLNIAVDNTYGTGGIVYAFANTNPNIGLATVGTGSTTQFVALNKTNIPQEATLIMGAVVKHMGSRSVDVYETYTNTLYSTEVLADSCMDVARPDTIHVMVMPKYEYFDTVTICSSSKSGMPELPYAWQNQILTSPGNYTASYASVIGGCDSVYHLVLNVNPSYHYYDTINVPMWNTASVYSNIPTVKLPYTYAVHQGVSYVCDSIGDFEFNFKTVDGCDSIAYVNVNTYPMMRTIADLNGNRSNKQIYCYGDTVNLNIAVDNTYGAGGIVYAFANTNPNIGLATVGTGSTTQFVALNNTNIPQEATLIMGAIVKHMGSRSVDVFETYTNTLYSTEVLADSCMDVARPDTIHVMVMPKYEYFDTAIVCSNELANFQWQGMYMLAAGDYDTTYASVIGGCDSTYHLHLIVNPAYLHQTDHVELCANQLPYEYNNSGRYITDAILTNAVPGFDVRDTVIFNFQTVDGCDSIIYVGVTVHPLFTTTMKDTVCGLGTYAKNGFNETFTEVGVHVISRIEQTVYGCDSTIIDTVIVSAPFVQYDTMSICSSMLPYTWHGRSLNNMGTHYDSLTNRYGCDSVYVLTLISFPTYLNQWDSVELCATAIPYNFRNSGRYITATPRIQLGIMQNTDAIDTFKFHYYTVHGCDSIVYVRALVHPTYMTILTDTACIGNYNKHGFNEVITTPGFKQFSKKYNTVNGCDSVVNLTVYVAPNYYFKVSESICAGVPYLNHGLSFVKDTAGDYMVRYNGRTVLGCDSIIDIKLTVYPSYSKPSAWTHLYPSVCRGETYSLNGFYVATRNLPANKHVHNDTNIYKTVNGCDSVVHLQLTINDSVVKRYSASICLGDRYMANGFSVQPTSAGVFVYTNARIGKNGCDSTAILTLTVGQTYNTTFYDEVCEGELYQKHGFSTIVTTNGTRLTHNYKSQRLNGCDSIITVVLTVHPKGVAPIINDYICREEGVYNKNGFSVVLPAGLKSIAVNDTLHTVFGCDSIRSLHLDIYDGKDTNIVASVCEGERYHTYGFDTTIYVPGVYHFKHSLKTTHGCDSNITLTLTVKPTYTSYLTVNICQGDSINYGGKFYGAGTHKIVYAHTANVCDSILWLTVSANPLMRETQNVRICRNVQGYYTFKGQNLTQSGVYYDTIPYNGCYKIITLNLTFIDTASRPTYINGPMNIYNAGNYNYTCDTVPYNVTGGIPAVDAYLWETSDTTWTVVTSNMENATINIPKPGSGFIYVSVHNECGYSSKTSLKVFAKVSVVDAESDNADVNIFPNPTNADYSIRINGMEGKTQISIADLTGRIIMRDNVEVSVMDNTFHYSAENYPKGVYLISILNGDKTVVKKLVVQ